MLENPWSAVGNPTSALSPSGSSFGPSGLAPVGINHLLLSNVTTDGFPGLFATDSSELIRFDPYVLVLSSHFSAVGSVRQINLTYVSFRAHVKIASRIVSYRKDHFTESYMPVHESTERLRDGDAALYQITLATCLALSVEQMQCRVHGTCI